MVLDLWPSSTGAFWARFGEILIYKYQNIIEGSKTHFSRNNVSTAILVMSFMPFRCYPIATQTLHLVRRVLTWYMRCTSCFSYGTLNIFLVFFETCANLGHMYSALTSQNEANNSVLFHYNASSARSFEIRQPLSGGAFSGLFRSGGREGGKGGGG